MRRVLNNHYAIMMLIMIGMVIVTSLGVSYALFSTTLEGKKDVSLTSGLFQVAYQQNGGIINLSNAYPIPDSVGMTLDTYKFTVTNTGTIDAKYKVYLEEDSTVVNGVPKNMIKFSFQKGMDAPSAPALLSTLDLNNILVTSQSLKIGESIQYSIRIWLDESAGNDVQGRTYRSKIVVDSLQS